GRRIFLLSEMIHNPQVNADLQARGVRFLQDTQGRQLVSFDELRAEDVVIIPAFGTTLEIEKRLREIGIHTERYNTTCPFVEKVWNRSSQIAGKQYTIVVHGKPGHEETRATFSHAAAETPTVVVNQTTMLASDTQAIADFLRQGMIARYGAEEIEAHFADTRDTLCYATLD